MRSYQFVPLCLLGLVRAVGGRSRDDAPVGGAGFSKARIRQMRCCSKLYNLTSITTTHLLLVSMTFDRGDERLRKAQVQRLQNSTL